MLEDDDCNDLLGGRRRYACRDPNMRCQCVSRRSKNASRCNSCGQLQPDGTVKCHFHSKFQPHKQMVDEDNIDVNQTLMEASIEDPEDRAFLTRYILRNIKDMCRRRTIPLSTDLAEIRVAVDAHAREYRDGRHSPPRFICLVIDDQNHHFVITDMYEAVRIESEPYTLRLQIFSPDWPLGEIRDYAAYILGELFLRQKAAQIFNCPIGPAIGDYTIKINPVLFATNAILPEQFRALFSLAFMKYLSTKNVDGQINVRRELYLSDAPRLFFTGFQATIDNLRTTNRFQCRAHRFDEAPPIALSREDMRSLKDTLNVFYFGASFTVLFKHADIGVLNNSLRYLNDVDVRQARELAALRQFDELAIVGARSNEPDWLGGTHVRGNNEDYNEDFMNFDFDAGADEEEAYAEQREPSVQQIDARERMQLANQIDAQQRRHAEETIFEWPPF